MGTVACEQLYSMVPKFEEIRKFGMKEAEVDGISPTKCRHGSTSVNDVVFHRCDDSIGLLSRPKRLRMRERRIDRST